MSLENLAEDLTLTGKIERSQEFFRAFRNDGTRSGEAAFNAVSRVDPAIAERLRGTAIDPFYDDARVERFWRHVYTSWAVVL